MSDIKLGCHVGMAGKDMFLASAREAASYGANVFILWHETSNMTDQERIIRKCRALYVFVYAFQH